MELKINLATASLKDAEHAIFIIGAYFGMTNLPTAPVVSGTPPAALSPVAAAAIVAAAQVAPMTAAPLPSTGTSDPFPTVDNGPVIAAAREQMAADPVATFAAHPAALPPGAGETPMTADPAAVFAGNAATVPGTPLATPGAGPSATPAAGAAVGDAGNVAAGVAGPAGSPSAGTTPPALSHSPVTPAGVDVDKNGLPWDARIHASGEGGKKPKNADGSWRKKRGLNDAALVAKVEAELRQTMAAGTPAAQPQAQVATPPAMPPAQPPSPPAMPPQPPAMPQQPAAGPQPAPTTFEQLMPRVTAATIAGTLPQGALLQAVTAYALPNIPALSSRPDLVPSVWTYMQSMYPAIA